MLIRRKLPPVVASLGLLLLFVLSAAIARRAAFLASDLQAGRPLPMSGSPGDAAFVRTAAFWAEILILLAATVCAFGLFRFHRASRRVLNALLVAGLLLVLYKGAGCMSEASYRPLAPYALAAAGAFAMLIAFNHSDVAEMYHPVWEGHEIPVFPVPTAILLGVAVAGLALGLFLQQSHAKIMRWML